MERERVPKSRQVRTSFVVSGCQYNAMPRGGGSEVLTTKPTTPAGKDFQLCGTSRLGAGSRFGGYVPSRRFSQDHRNGDIN